MAGITTAPILLKDVSLTLIKTSDIATGDPVEYRCQLSQAELQPTAASSSGATLETFCNSYSASGAGNATWVLALSGFQAYGDVTDLSLLLFDNEGEDFTYTLMPAGGVPSATNPGFSGEVVLVPTNIGGTANQYGTFTVSLPCKEKPVKVVAPPTGVFA